jgi:hypothetical protein
VSFRPSRLQVALFVVAITITGLLAMSLAVGPSSARRSAGRVSLNAPNYGEQDRGGTQVREAVMPREFAVSVAKALYRYDTRSPRVSWRSALLSAAGIAESSAAAQDIDDAIPDDAQWTDMAAVYQRASFLLGTAFVPSLWTETVVQHPELPDGSVGFTVTGTQVVTWTGGGSRVPVAITLLVLCPPATERCVVNRVLAQVAR